MVNFMLYEFHLNKLLFKKKKKLFQAEKLEWGEIFLGTEIYTLPGLFVLGT